MDYFKAGLQKTYSDAERGKTWHYLDSNAMICKREKSLFHLPAEARGLLPGHDRVCALEYNRKNPESKIFICAVPDNGGDYLILARALNYELLNLASNDGLVEIVKLSLEAERKFKEKICL